MIVYSLHNILLDCFKFKQHLKENTVISKSFFHQTIRVNQGNGPETEIKPK